ncbi:MAG: hypothetical protein QF464_05180 [Myxococcota bacterium]|nr:hypothetical protein [Myxococcota bacterium]
MNRYAMVALIAGSLLLACGGDAPAGDVDDSATATDSDAHDVALTPDTQADTAIDDALGAQGDADSIEPPAPLVALNWPIFEAPQDPLADGPVESCAVFREEDCGPGGTTRHCDLYDVEAAAFDEAPEAMLRRAYQYDRWYDLFSSPDGQTAERLFTEEMPPGTAEEVWTDPANFAGWSGAGDSAIWTGTALNAFILRYLHTGTEADYQRMEEKARVMLRFFEVTRIPGYLARYHYLLVEPGTPAHPEHIYRYAPDEDPDHRDIEDPQGLGFLPDHYFDSGLGTPRWSGDPSIDQYNGPMVAFPMVYGLLRDEELKERIAYHMVCYLNALRRIELINLQQNQEAQDAFLSLFGGGENLNLDETDMTFEELDRIVMYVHPQINTANEDVYDRACGDPIDAEPWRVIDAAGDTFIFDLLELVQDISREENRPNQINHFYIPSVRGGDAVHMMHLNAMAYAFTGDDHYMTFLEDELVGGIQTDRVAEVMSAFVKPRYCRKFYGTNITAGPLWAFNNLLAASPMDTLMQEVFRDEMYAKETVDDGNVNVFLMFAGAVSEALGGAQRETALGYALEELARFGGNGGVLEDPRRTYAQSFDEVVAAMPEGITPQCATEDERALCELPLTVFGAVVEESTISFECTGASSECVMADGLCTRAMASGPLPGPIRYWGDYAWQRSPFKIGRSGPGIEQSPGTDYAEQYWMARFYGFIDAPTEVLAWRDTGVACE